MFDPFKKSREIPTDKEVVLWAQSFSTQQQIPLSKQQPPFFKKTYVVWAFVAIFSAIFLLISKTKLRSKNNTIASRSSSASPKFIKNKDEYLASELITEKEARISASTEATRKKVKTVVAKRTPKKRKRRRLRKNSRREWVRKTRAIRRPSRPLLGRKDKKATRKEASDHILPPGVGISSKKLPRYSTRRVVGSSAKTTGQGIVPE